MSKTTVLVCFKPKFTTNFDSDTYSYWVPDAMKVYIDDIVCVNTCYGLEIAKVVKGSNLSDQERGKANKYIYSVIKPGLKAEKDAKIETREFKEVKSTSIPVW